jgi:carbon starvation protein CstA
MKQFRSIIIINDYGTLISIFSYSIFASSLPIDFLLYYLQHSLSLFLVFYILLL